MDPKDSRLEFMIELGLSQPAHAFSLASSSSLQILCDVSSASTSSPAHPLSLCQHSTPLT